MSDTKVSGLASQASLASDDLFPTIDISDTSMAGTGTDKKVTLATLTTYILGVMYPVGSIYTEITGTNPGTTFGFGTWAAWGTGRVPVGVDTNDANFNTVEKTGGASTITLDSSQMPAHVHGVGGGVEFIASYVSGSGSLQRPTSGNNAGSFSQTASTGGGGAHNNLQQFITCWMWKRSA